MTTFQGPLAVVSGVGAGTQPATAMRVAADTCAQFHGDVITSGRMRNGPFAGIYGHQLLVQGVTVDMQTATAKVSIMNFPPKAAITRIMFSTIDDSLSTAACDLNLRVTTSAGGTVSAYINWLPAGISDGSLLANQNYWQWPGQLNANGLLTAQRSGVFASLPTADTKWFIQSTATSGAVTSKRGFLTVEYFRRS